MTHPAKVDQEWDLVVQPRTGLFSLHLGDIWRYRELVLLFVKRDLVVTYKQTILGPLWFVIQPVVSTVILTIIFGNIAKIPTDGIPPFLFYLAGTTAWGYFASCVNGTSNTFNANSGVFGKVYFPRMAVPLSIVVSSIAKFLIQFCLFVGFYCYFYFSGSDFSINLSLLMLPLLVLQMAILGLGVGVFISSLVTKYRDLTFLMGFAIQLWMYACPIIYPLSQVPEKYRDLYMLNPMASVIETFKYSFFGIGSINSSHIIISWIVTLIIFGSGLVMFNKIEKSFMDTV